MAADKIIRNSKLDTFLSKLATKLTAIFWRKAETTQVTIDDTPTAGSNNLVKSSGVKSYVDNAIPSVPTISTDITADATSDTKTTSPKAVKTFVEGKGYGTYTKPANGIPASDIEAGVIPDAVEANPTVPSGTTPTTLQNVKVGSSYYSVPQGSSTTLSTNVTTDKADNTKASTPKSVYDFVKPTMGSSIPVGGLLPGVKYHLGTLTGSITMTLASPSDASVENEWKFTFTADSTAPTITWDNAITAWAGNCLDSNGVPEITAGKYYEVSVMDGVGIIVEV